MTDIYRLNKANYAAIVFLDEVGLAAPIQAEIDRVERVLADSSLSAQEVEAKISGVVGEIAVFVEESAIKAAARHAVKTVMYGTRSDLSVCVLSLLGIISPTECQMQLIEELLLGLEPCDGLSCLNLLTKKQKECLYWTAQGINAVETGKRMNISKTTVISHRSAIVNALGCKNITHAVYKWMKLRGLCEPLAG